MDELDGEMAVTEATLAARALAVAELSAREELYAAWRQRWNGIVEDAIIGRRRILLRREQQLVDQERQLLHDEARTREELETIESRKFEMFVSLCSHGIRRLRLSEPKEWDDW